MPVYTSGQAVQKNLTIQLTSDEIDSAMGQMLSYPAPYYISLSTMVTALFNGVGAVHEKGWRLSDDRRNFEIWIPTENSERELWKNFPPRWDFHWFPV
jgi:hypothetical protein